MAIFQKPIRTDPPGDIPQDITGQVWDSDPGQNQKPHVVGQKVEVCFSCISIPADKVIPGSDLPSRRAKEQAGRRFLHKLF